MANAFYTLGVEKFLKGSISWNSDTIDLQLIDDTNYTPNLSTHEFLSDVSGTSYVGSATALSSKTTTGGRAGAGNTTISSVSSGSTVKYVLLYKSTGTAGTSPLICLLDTGNGLPFATNGGDIIVVWDSGANGIFLLTPWWVAAVAALTAWHAWLGRVGFRVGALFSRLAPARVKRTQVLALRLPGILGGATC